MRRALLTLFCASTTLLPVVDGSQLSQYELSNDKIALVLDEQGHLAKLTNRQTGNSYVDGGNHAPWRMYYRSGTPLTGALDLAIDPDTQKAQVRVEKNSLVISYASLTAHVAREGQTRELQVGLTLRVALEDDRLAWVATVQNREFDKTVEITEIWIPWISGIGDLGLGQRADVLYWPDRAGRRIANPYARISSAAAGPVAPDLSLPQILSGAGGSRIPAANRMFGLSSPATIQKHEKSTLRLANKGVLSCREGRIGTPVPGLELRQRTATFRLRVARSGGEVRQLAGWARTAPECRRVHRPRFRCVFGQ